MKARPPLPDDIKQLMALVRAGRLFDVQRWIAEGKPTVPPEPYWFSLLRVAIETGFHSMVEILLKAGIDQDEKNTLLNRVVWNSDFNLIQLLVDHGADIHAVDFTSVCSTGNPEIIRFFLDRGMDAVTGNPFAHALEHPKRPFIGIYLRYREKIPELNHQVNLALRHHAREGNLKWVSLLLWAGADPHVRLPEIDSDPDPDFDSTALEEAVRSGHEEVINKIGIDPQKADLGRLLVEACLNAQLGLIERLLNLGAPPNGTGDREPMGSLLGAFAWRIHSFFGPPSGADLHAIFTAILSLADRGGRWNPTRSSLNRFRRDLYKLDASWMERIATEFHQHQVCSPELIAALMNTPKMKQILGFRHAACLAMLASRPRSPAPKDGETSLGGRSPGTA